LLKEIKKCDYGCGICMIIWVREPKRRRLTRIELEPKPEFEIEKKWLNKIGMKGP